MLVSIANTFNKSLHRLQNRDRERASLAVLSFIENPKNPGLRWHQLDRFQDPNFGSISVTDNIRIIAHKLNESFHLCYVDRHDEAYNWARRRKIEKHSVTGALQIVKLPEMAPDEITQEKSDNQSSAADKKNGEKIFARFPKERLLNSGVPDSLLDEVTKWDEATFLSEIDDLPGEAAEALFDLLNETNPVVYKSKVGEEPLSHPDTLRRFRQVSSEQELKRALDSDWEQWLIYLHPNQRQCVYANHSGAARIQGGAGTGKTVVCVHRAVYLAQRYPKKNILLLTFSRTLATAIQLQVDLLLKSQSISPKNLRVVHIHQLGWELFNQFLGTGYEIGYDDPPKLLRNWNQRTNSGLSLSYLISEWNQVFDFWQLSSFEEYLNLQRRGRGRPLGSHMRQKIWDGFQEVREKLWKARKPTWNMVFAMVSKHLIEEEIPRFGHVIVDEAQDMGPKELELIRTLARGENDLFLCGDFAQRIYQHPFSWRSIGIDVRGRVSRLRVNYRTSHQIKDTAENLRPIQTQGEGRKNHLSYETVSVFDGPEPVFLRCQDVNHENRELIRWVKNRLAEKIEPVDIAVLVRHKKGLSRVKNLLSLNSLPVFVMDGDDIPQAGKITVSTMHRSKGLEFRAVVLLSCNQRQLPSQQALANITYEDEKDLIYAKERNLLYVACTRARDYLLISTSAKPSPFLDEHFTS